MPINALSSFYLSKNLYSSKEGNARERGKHLERQEKRRTTDLRRQGVLMPESTGVLCNPRLTGLGDTPGSNRKKGHCSHPAMEVMGTLQRDNILSELLLIYIHCVTI